MGLRLATHQLALRPERPGPGGLPTETTTYSVDGDHAGGCERFHDVTVSVVPGAPGDSIYPTVPSASANRSLLQADEGSTWIWSPTTGLNNPASQTRSPRPLETTTYTVTISNLCGEGTDEVTVELIVPEAFVEPGGSVCAGEPFPVSARRRVLPMGPGSLTTNSRRRRHDRGHRDLPDLHRLRHRRRRLRRLRRSGRARLGAAQVEAGPDQRQDWLEPTFLYGSVQGQPHRFAVVEPCGPLSCSDCLIPEVLLQEDMTFTLHVIDTNGCRSADVVQVEFNYPLYVPSAFTPDGDGLNDGWRPESQWLNGAGTYLLGLPDATLLPGYRLEIWDRWGTCIWATEDPAPLWTGGVGGPGMAPGRGRHRGRTAPRPCPGVYTWVRVFPTSKGTGTADGPGDPRALTVRFTGINAGSNP